MTVSRRSLLAASGGLAVTTLLRPLQSNAAQSSVPPELLKRALGAMERHGSVIANRETIAIADFSLPSRAPRLHLVDIASGRISSHLVAHGRGSDPAHTGWLHRFSNTPQSKATSSGTYCTQGLYTGAHGRSIRLAGLDATNDNAGSRGIVVHAAWYVSPSVAHTHG